MSKRRTFARPKNSTKKRTIQTIFPCLALSFKSFELNSWNLPCADAIPPPPSDVFTWSILWVPWRKKHRLAGVIWLRFGLLFRSIRARWLAAFRFPNPRRSRCRFDEKWTARRNTALEYLIPRGWYGELKNGNDAILDSTMPIERLCRQATGVEFSRIYSRVTALVWC